ncbi:MAG: helix-turn-helix transcriptional regulator [Candidatus Xenobia bacterium]
MRDRDVRAIAQLCMETAEFEDRAAALEHYLARVTQLIGADVVSLFGIHAEHGRFQGGAGFAHGFDDTQLGLLHRWDFDQPSQSPLNDAMYNLGDPRAVRVRRDLVDDTSWYGHPDTDQRARHLGLDDVLVAIRSLGEDSALLHLSRSCGSRPFTDEDEARVSLLCDLSRWFWEGLRHSGIVRAVRNAPPLPPRLEKVLQELLLGYSEKEIAQRLGYKHATLHRYVEQLYRRFEVSSRPELMARWIPKSASSFHPVNASVVSRRR